jgi:hypothetical protein
MESTEFTKYDNGLELSFMSTGLCPGCEVCRQAYNMNAAEFTVAYDLGRIADEPSFSWQPCELCGSDLGGNRYAAHGRDHNGDICHIDICKDCLQAM